MVSRMDRHSDTRSMGSGRSRGKQRLPLPSQQGGALGEMDLLSQFSDSQPSKSSHEFKFRSKDLLTKKKHILIMGILTLKNSKISKSSKRNLPLPSQMGDRLTGGSDLLSGLVSNGEFYEKLF